MQYTIRELRARKKWTIQHLADVCGCSKVHLVRIENDKATPSVHIALAIAKALDVKVEEIKW